MYERKNWRPAQEDVIYLKENDLIQEGDEVKQQLEGTWLQTLCAGRRVKKNDVGHYRRRVKPASEPEARYSIVEIVRWFEHCKCDLTLSLTVLLTDPVHGIAAVTNKKEN